MAVVRNRAVSLRKYVRLAVFMTLGTVCILSAVGFMAIAAWMLIKIFFVTALLTIKAFVFFVASVVTATLGYGAFSLSGKRLQRRFEPLPENTHPVRKTDGMIVVWEKGTMV